MQQNRKISRLKHSLPGLCLSVAVLVGAAIVRAQDLDTRDSRAISLYAEGQQLAQAEKFSEALEKFRQAILADSNFVEAHLRYMDAFRSVGRGDEVSDMYRNKSTQNPRSALYHFLYGRAQQDLAAKRAEFRSALDIDSTFYWAQFGIGGSYMLEQRYDEAIVALNKALEMNPKMIDAMRLLGSVYLEKGMPFQARRVFEQAVEIDSGDASLYLRLGQVYSQMERYETAEKYFMKAAALSPNEPLIYYYLALLYEISGQKERAIETYRKFLKIAPGHELAASAKSNLDKLQK